MSRLTSRNSTPPTFSLRNSRNSHNWENSRALDALFTINRFNEETLFNRFQPNIGQTNPLSQNRPPIELLPTSASITYPEPPSALLTGSTSGALAQRSPWVTCLLKALKLICAFTIGAVTATASRLLDGLCCATQAFLPNAMRDTFFIDDQNAFNTALGRVAQFCLGVAKCIMSPLALPLGGIDYAILQWKKHEGRDWVSREALKLYMSRNVGQLTSIKGTRTRVLERDKLTTYRAKINDGTLFNPDGSLNECGLKEIEAGFWINSEDALVSAIARIICIYANDLNNLAPDSIAPHKERLLQAMIKMLARIGSLSDKKALERVRSTSAKKIAHYASLYIPNGQRAAAMSHPSLADFYRALGIEGPDGKAVRLRQPDIALLNALKIKLKEGSLFVKGKDGTFAFNHQEIRKTGVGMGDVAALLVCAYFDDVIGCTTDQYTYNYLQAIADALSKMEVRLKQHAQDHLGGIFKWYSDQCKDATMLSQQACRVALSSLYIALGLDPNSTLGAPMKATS